MQKPRWWNHWTIKALGALCSAYVAIYVIASFWRPTTWYGVFFVICGLFLLYGSCKEIYELIRKPAKA
jgi:uncharacterized membrane protein HdeD (DUF308 family)